MTSKQLLSSLFIFLVTLPTHAYDFQVDGIYYNVIGENEVEVTAGDKAYRGSVTIPASVVFNKSYQVTGIGGRAFQGCSDLMSVVSKITEPFPIESNVFAKETISNGTLTGPNGTKETYQSMEYRNEFKEIISKDNLLVRFVDETGNAIPDGATVYITEGKDDGWGGMMFPTGLYVENVGGEVIYVGIDVEIVSIPNGGFQMCFPENVIYQSNTGTFSTQIGSLSVDQKRCLHAEWLPAENGFGICNVKFSLKIYTFNAVTKEYTLASEGPSIIFNMKYSDEGNDINSIILNAENFPDDNFRSYISKLTGVAEGDMLNEEKLQSVKSINVNQKGISSLQGIEYFTALTYLFCGSNQLTSLDVSKNTALTNLSCYSNQLTSLDVSHTTALTNLICDYNQLTSLDVSKNIALTNLLCEYNQLTSLDVSHNTALTYLSCYSNQLTSLDVSHNTALTKLLCEYNQLTSLDVSHNTALTSLYCGSNQLTSLYISNNTKLVDLWCNDNQLKTLDVSNNTLLRSIGCQHNQLMNINLIDCVELEQYHKGLASGVLNSGIKEQAISLMATPMSNNQYRFAVPYDFDIKRVSEFKVNGEAVAPTVANNYLTFSYSQKPQTIIYQYDSGNSKAGMMGVTVYLTTGSEPTVELIIQSTGNGSVTYNGITVRNQTQMFTVAEGTSATITFAPDNGYRVARVKVNNTDVTEKVSNYQYTINNISANNAVAVIFEKETPVETEENFVYNGIRFRGTIATLKAQVTGVETNIESVEIPASVINGSRTYSVTSVADDALAGTFNYISLPSSVTSLNSNSLRHSDIGALIWNANKSLTANVFNNVPFDVSSNFLLYVNAASYAPSNVKNVVVGNTAKAVLLSDAGGQFYCPKEFVAQNITYTHNYSMKTGGNGQGWESIVLPFDVQRISHTTKGEIVPFAAYNANDRSQRPFWLYRFGASGFVRSSSISANTPYIIAMPNNTAYDDEYILAGDVTFSATNVTVKPSSQLSVSTSGGKTFTPAYRKIERSSSVYALNVNNRNASSSGGYDWGSRFIGNLRDVYPFEAYMLTSSAEAREFIEIEFEDEVTGLDGIPMRNDSERKVAVYSISGQLIMREKRGLLDEKLHSLPSGIYIVDGNKTVVQ